MGSTIDVSKRKPRRLRGTPAYKFANKWSAIILGGSILIAVLHSFSPFSSWTYARIKELKPEGERDPTIKLPFLGDRSSDQVEQMLKGKEGMKSKS